LRFVIRGGIELVYAMEAALGLRLPENVTEIAVFLEGVSD
jgi:hypothetical protein